MLEDREIYLATLKKNTEEWREKAAATKATKVDESAFSSDDDEFDFWLIERKIWMANPLLEIKPHEVSRDLSGYSVLIYGEKH